jgi:glycine/serine hydroxymethyltransferase
MDQKIKNYILAQPADRQSILSDIHSIILDKDKSVTSEIEPMMGKEMIIYKANGMMKYGLAGVKNYMSLHVLPIYGSKTLFEKYKSLLTRANFQKGCINFDTAEKMPLDIVRQLFSDCSKVDLKKIREDQLNERKLRAKAKK